MVHGRPRSERAGTVLNLSRSVPILGRRQKGEGTSQHGYYDASQRLYQGGGEARNFIYRARNVVSFDLLAWQNIVRKQPERLELVDNETNTVYEIPFLAAVRLMQPYKDPNGRARVGVPTPYWTVRDHRGVVLKDAQVEVDAAG